MKIALVNDTHFGARGDSPIFNKYFFKFWEGTFFPYLKEHNISQICHLGDVVDRRKFINFVTLRSWRQRFFDVLQREDITMDVIVGNHDVFHKNTNEINALKELLSSYAFDVHTEATNITIDSCPILLVPWITLQNESHTMRMIEETKAQICMGHFEIAGFSMYRGMESHDGLSKDTFNKFDLVFSGHYHHRSSDGQIHYLGNPYELTWQDYNDPRGFHLFDTGTRRLDFIENPYRMFARLEYSDREKDPIDLDAYDLKGLYVKLIVVDKTDYYKFDTFIKKLYNKGCHEIKIIEDMSEFNDGEIGEEINLEDTLSVLSHYIDSIETDVDKEHVKTYMRTLYTEAVNIEV